MHDQATSLRYSRPLLGSLLIPVLLLGACTMKTRDYSELGEGEGEGCPAADCTPGAKRCDGAQVVEVCSDYDGDGCPEWGGGVDCPTGSRCEDGRCLAICLPECVPGQRVCSGRGYRTCGDADEDGCPDQYKLVVVTDTRIELKQMVFFATDKATILKKSYDLLNEVAQVLLDRPKIKVRIEGHTDSRGSDRHNLDLSQARADSVRAYLIRQGIDGSRMESIGHGENKPIEDNATAEGRAANRRVEFHIVAQ